MPECGGKFVGTGCSKDVYTPKNLLGYISKGKYLWIGPNACQHNVEIFDNSDDTKSYTFATGGLDCPVQLTC